MALRNAFDLIATEGTLRRVLRAVTFAKDANDRLRVVVDSAASTNVAGFFGNTNNAAPTYYTTGASTAMDQRDLLAVMSQANFQAVRNQRWSL